MQKVSIEIERYIMSEREIKMRIADKLEEMSKAISRGKDVEITKTSSGIAIKEVAKKKIV